MNEACARFEQHLKRRHGQRSTPIHYISDLRIFIRIIGDKQPESITATDIDHFVQKQVSVNRSPTTINRRLSAIHTFFEFLASEKPEDDLPNPVNHRRHALKTGSPLPRDVSDSDVNKIFAVMSSERDRAMFGLMIGAGLRVGEVASLRLSSIEPSTMSDGLARLRVCGKGEKERNVWLTNQLFEMLQAWLQVRPVSDTDHLFLNHHRQRITVNGIQYRLSCHCKAANVTLSCHQLRHTFGRRMAESGLAVDSLARLLGHEQLQTTQRYIDGANPTVRADFATAMATLEVNLIKDQVPPSLPQNRQNPKPKPRVASESELLKMRRRLKTLPPWLATALDGYISWHWPTWRAQTAKQLGDNLLSLARRFSDWLAIERPHVVSWETLRRADLAAWKAARHEDGVSNTTIRNDLARLRSVLRFLEARDYPLDPGLFRVKPPKSGGTSLPRYLSEADYRWLETNVLQATIEDTYHNCFDRAWFLMLAHTGIRLSELLDLRLGDLNFQKGYATIRSGKNQRDRVVFLTPQLTNALKHYLHQRPDVPEEDRLFLLHSRSATSRTIQRRLRMYGKKVDVAVSPHRLRHTLATRLINQGMPIHSLKKLLGHQNLDTTQIYARIYDQTLLNQFSDAMSQLDELMLDQRPKADGRMRLPNTREVIDTQHADTITFQ
jgi:site-specific recombinase XerD